jgi:molecular chaperone Hsp33
MTNPVNHVQRFIFTSAPARGVVANLSEAWHHVLSTAPYPDFIQTYLGELSVATSLLIANLKMKGVLSLQIQTLNLDMLLVAESNTAHTFRCMAKYPKQAVHDAASFRAFLSQHQAQLILTISAEQSEPWQGIVPMIDHDIEASLSHYMMQSEQTDTVIKLSSSATHLHGLLVQKLPSTTDESLDDWERIKLFTQTIQAHEIVTDDYQQLLSTVFHEESLNLLPAQAIAFACTCTPDKINQVLQLITPEQQQELLNDRGLIEITCDFCQKSHAFTPRS